MTLILSTTYSKCRLRVPVDSLETAQTYFESWRDSNSLASSEMGPECGLILDDDRETAFLSYNGRCWTDRSCSVELLPHFGRGLRGPKDYKGVN
ncbi:MAG TPA: hypothetical protein VMW38_25075 [Terriglobia bacterium]|nr:hypothetical protein [Terriglobia bacterium]